MMQIIANNDEPSRAINRGGPFSDLKSHGGGGRVRRAVNPAAIYAQYAKARARRQWAIMIIAALSALSWAVMILLVIAAFSVV